MGPAIMPLELDDREPPEDDPDAPAPATTLLRIRPQRLISLAGLPADAGLARRAREALAGRCNIAGNGQLAPATVAMVDPMRTCILMRARQPDTANRGTSGCADTH